MSETNEKRPPRDIAILNGPTEDGKGARVVRFREGEGVSAGEIRPVRNGEPVNQSELVRLHPLDSNKRVCAVEVLHGGQAAAPPAERSETEKRSAAGPARVSNEKYRQNWSAIFGNDKDYSLN
jgi:hypothetical protein